MKKYLPDILVIVAFAVLSFVYFFPADTEGRILFQHDTAAGAGAGREAQEYYERTGERTRWTDALFGGMPTYQISPSYDSTGVLSTVQRIYQLFLPNYVYLTFIMMLGLRHSGMVCGHRRRVVGLLVLFLHSDFGGTYLEVHHSGLHTAYHCGHGAGVSRTVAGGRCGDRAVCGAADCVQSRADVLLLPVCHALPGHSLWGTSLAHADNATVSPCHSRVGRGGYAAKQTSGGLDRDYITQWSYGIDETWTLLVPNYKGGASVPLSMSETAMEKANPRYAGLYNSLTQYFGTQPMTAGPVYVGAFVLFLFLMGCFVVKGPLKWALLGGTVFSILLSWGKNMMWLTDLFIDYVPMYDKFRAVSSILVIAEFTIPLLAMLALVKILKEPELLRKQWKGLVVCLVLTAGVALWMAVPGTPSPAHYVPAQEMQMLQSAADQGYLPAQELPGILANLSEMRAALVQSDALRSFVIVMVGVLLLWLYAAGKLRRAFAVGGIALLCLVDMWSVNKRYLNDEQFVSASTQQTTFAQTAADKFILQDKDPDYRVLNLASNTFNENNTSYWHKSIGGYHAAKLRRYQELIDHHIAPEMQALYSEIVNKNGQMDSVDAAKYPVLNMLNMRYVILPGAEQGQTIPLRNPYALGNGWFVDRVQYVTNANEEINALHGMDPATTAAVDQRFRDALQGLEQPHKDSLSVVRLTAYEPNRVVYETENTGDGVAVFSEIYYPDGWQVTVDGEPAPLARANYVLRALYLPAGKHTVEMHFDPQSLHVTEGIAYAGLSLLAVGALVAVGLGWRRSRRKEI